MDICNWDLIYACSGEYINKQLISNPNCYITDFQYEDDLIQMSGAFGRWQMVFGKSGTIIQFNTPITNGSFTIKASNETVPLDGTVPLVQMQLFLNCVSDQSAAHQLVFNCKTVGKGPDDATSGAVTVVNADVSGTLQRKTNGGLVAELLISYLSNCIIQLSDQLAIVFANMIPVLSGANYEWLTPATLTYVYQQYSDDTLGDIAILGLLDSGNNLTPPTSFDPSLLEGADFGFMLSANQLMKNVILPLLPYALAGSNIHDFTLNGAIIEQSNSFHLNNVKVGLIDYTPVVTSLSFQIEDTSMLCYVQTQTNITGLKDAYVTNSVTSNNISNFSVPDRSLRFLNDPNMTVTKDVYVPWWEEVLGSLTAGIMNLVIDAISVAIENAAAGVTSSENAEALGDIAPGLVSWIGQSAVTITDGGLQDNVFMKGIFN